MLTYWYDCFNYNLRPNLFLRELWIELIIFSFILDMPALIDFSFFIELNQMLLSPYSNILMLDELYFDNLNVLPWNSLTFYVVYFYKVCYCAVKFLFISWQGEVLLSSFPVIASFPVLLGYKKVLLTKSNKALVELNQFQIDIIVGCLLGDASMERYSPTANSRLRFDQTFPMHASYLTFIYSHFYHLTGAPPKVQFRKADKRTNKCYASMAFKTLALPCLNFYKELFYLNGVKIVPVDIANYLTPRSLSFWICDDGGKMLIIKQYFILDLILMLKIWFYRPH